MGVGQLERLCTRKLHLQPWRSLQLQAKPAELGGERVVDEEHVHGRQPLRREAASIENRSASRGRQTSWRTVQRTSSAAASPSGRCAGRVVEHGQGLASQRLLIDGVGQQPGLAVAETSR